MTKPTAFALKSIIVLSLIIILFIIITCYVYKTFADDNQKKKKDVKSKSVLLQEKFQNSDVKQGKIGIEIRISAFTIPQLLTATNSTTEATIRDKDIIYIATKDLEANKRIKWLEYTYPIQQHRLDEIEDNSTLYITEGGIFTPEEMEPTTTFHFHNFGYNDNDKDEYIFVKLSFPNGELPYMDETSDNSIIIYKLGDKSKSFMVPGIPKNSRLSLIIREKNDGIERITDLFRLPQKVSDLYISKDGKLSLIPQ